MQNYIANLDKLQAEAMIDGPKQAEKFSWTESAKLYLEVAEEIKWGSRLIYRRYKTLIACVALVSH